ncbi:MAG: indolepyruvate ferredoxin oxidoreductase family protein [Deltaproteobacteria bacterium]|nr:indolepyruvate ferredoxin oxidoreductase family protein [Deltaproteobacteria bacterium]
MPAAKSDLPPLSERYTQTQGRVHLTGLQALVRLPLEQLRRDRAAGQRIGALISGYPGSPLAGFDQELGRVKSLLEVEDVHFVPGLNEELALGTVAGTQLIDLFPHSRYDGVIGIWYGKAPGLDRSLDVLRHANFIGTARFGGALAVVGDDPCCKSSSLPSHSEHAFAHAMVPLLAPADAGEVLALGLHGFALSRYAGVWVGLKLVADVADGGAILDLAGETGPVELPKFQVRGESFQKQLDTRLLPPHVNRIEERILYERLEAVCRYAFENGMNPITQQHPRDRIGLVASGRLYRELETTLELLGIDDSRLAALGIRLLKMELLYPIEPRRLGEFADGLDEVIVVDERRGFLEDQIRSALFNTVDRPMVLGQRNESGEPWLARHSEVSAETLALDLGEHLAQRLNQPELSSRAGQLRAATTLPHRVQAPSRPPVFCSGCPHSSSTRLPEGAVAGGGIGCHTMALLMDREVKFVGAMGAEGSSWIGLSSFVDTPHLFQNLGDGTYFHSGRQAVRACVEAGVTMTFKLLYNGTIAMTGGQRAVGEKPIADIARDLLSDGVRRIVAVSDNRALLALARGNDSIKCISRERYEEAMAELAREPGVTALIYDQLCANQKQRLERRGLLPRPTEQILINQDVCEGCGDCGRKSTCVSLRPVPTLLGRKTRIHQSSCSDDRSCLEGDCPAFVSVSGPAAATLAREKWMPEQLPEPEPPAWEGERFQIYLVGIGSTGVVSTNAMLMRAAEIDGLYALHLDQTGLAQRGGKVVSHCLLGREPLRGSPRVSWGAADVLLAFDPISSCDSDSLWRLNRERTRAVVHEVLVPTGEMVSDPGLAIPEIGEFIGELRSRTRSLVALPAEALAEAALGEALAANVVMLGTAFQRGLLPLSLHALEQAIRDRGVAVETNLAALSLGRAVAADPGLVDLVLLDAQPPSIGETGSPERAASELGAPWAVLEARLSLFTPSAELETLRRELAGFALDLVDYQNLSYAQGFLGIICGVARAEAGGDPGSLELTRTAARELYRLMAYKDEYEVARLQLRGPFRRWLERRRGRQLKLRYHLHPPLLRALGLKRKLSFGPGIELLLHALVWLRRLRGTRLDPFGRTQVRREEWALIDWYARVLARLANLTRPEHLPPAIEIAAAAENIRGYENIKLERAEKVRAFVQTKLAALPFS